MHRLRYCWVNIRKNAYFLWLNRNLGLVVNGWGSFLCYFFDFVFLLSGLEGGSLLPFRLSFPVFGLRDAFSVSFSSFFSCFRAQRYSLYYLSIFLFLLTGAESIHFHLKNKKSQNYSSLSE